MRPGAHARDGGMLHPTTSRRHAERFRVEAAILSSLKRSAIMSSPVGLHMRGMEL